MYSSRCLIHVMISIERYFAVVHPFLYTKLFTRKMAYRIVCGIIFLSFLMWSPVNIGFFFISDCDKISIIIYS